MTLAVRMIHLPLSLAAFAAVFHEPLRVTALIVLAVSAVLWFRLRGNGVEADSRDGGPTGEVGDDGFVLPEGHLPGPVTNLPPSSSKKAKVQKEMPGISEPIRNRLVAMQEHDDELLDAAAETKLLALNAFFEAARAGEVACKRANVAREVFLVTELAAEGRRTVCSSAALSETLDAFVGAGRDGADEREDS